MFLARHWRPALVGCLVACLLGCGGSGGGAGGTGGSEGGVGGMGGVCTDEAINACLDLQECCRAILVNPVFFQSCNSVVLQCDEDQCRAVLAGYVQCRDREL